ncbi:sensor domain-containing phosphodiesterase [Dyella acidiphila]|uniref:Sensor domain-containing phosphodiesterase n=1 Tax=Dyella acidiphila TaxID=2775866 RepID=A0ABR9GCJ1_9GAMM|nr:sensor domain-containing phosphodiesterase [Dyella acidiphila]MBE1161760.1 sensor domain-containing phosphodiesterase [Dyella acidiphila]
MTLKDLPGEEPGESKRQRDLWSLRLLDSPREEQLDVITQLTAQSLNMPVALITLVDRHRQWFKSTYGWDAQETPRDVSFCSFALHEPELLVVEDATRDVRFADNPLVTGEPHVRFYAGAVIRSPAKTPLGTLCVVDHKPRTLSSSDRQQLLRLAQLVESEIRQRNLVGKLLAEIEKDKELGEERPVLGRTEIYGHVVEAIKQGRPFVLGLGRLRPFELARSLNIPEDELHRELLERLRLLPADVTYGAWRQDSFALFKASDATVGIPALVADLERCLGNAFEILPHGRYATVCVGISEYPADGISARTLFQAADSVLPSHTSSNKLLNVAVHSSAGKTPEHLKEEMIRRLQDGILHDRIYLEYQPIVDIYTRALVRAEALLRWKDPELGNVSPADFIPVAEKSGLIVRLGSLVITNIVKDMQARVAAGKKPIPISLNISGKQIRDPEFITFLQDSLKNTPLSPGDLELEVTESSLIEDLPRAAETMKEVHRMGITCAIDDFGVGFSSFNYLRHLPVRNLKIDKDFVREVDTNQRDNEIVSAIIRLAHALGMSVTAEGVETEEQLHALRNLGCDLIQGYLIARPNAFEALNEYC